MILIAAKISPRQIVPRQIAVSAMFLLSIALPSGQSVRCGAPSNSKVYELKDLAQKLWFDRQQLCDLTIDKMYVVIIGVSIFL